MTLDDYLSKEKFPLTSREGYSPRNQMLVDAINWDIFQERLSDDPPLTEQRQAVLAELNQKIPAHKEVMAELLAQEKLAKTQAPEMSGEQGVRILSDADDEVRFLRMDPDVEVDRFFDDSSRSMGEPPRFVLLSGGSGSGKTTVRQKRYTPGFVVVDAGEIFFSLCQGKRLPFPDWLEEAMDFVGRSVVWKAMEERRHIVTEIIGTKLETVKTLMNAMHRIGYAPELAFVDCDPKTACMHNLTREDDWISATYSEPYHLRWLIESADEIASEQPNRIAKSS